MIRENNAKIRMLNLDQPYFELARVDLDIGGSKLQCCLKAIGTMMIRRQATPNLFFSHKKNRVNYILDQIAPDRKTFDTDVDRIQVDAMRFYLMRDREKVRMFPEEEEIVSANMQLKSHIPKLMFISAISHPDPSWDLDGKIGIYM